MSDIKNTSLIPPAPAININSLRPFNKFCVTIGMLPSSYKTSLTYEEQLLWLCNYLEETVIPAVNNNGEAVAELQALYEELRSYIDNYFTNLDVQEEINNKLDKMAEDGTLIDIIKSYVDPFIEIQNNNIENISNIVDNLSIEIQNVASGSPLVASSISEMIDTSRIYVNTTDGYWYYYNGSNWVQGGVYQATQSPEVENIRIAYNEKVYNTAGNAVRGQMNSVKNDMEYNLKDVISFTHHIGDNMFNKNTILLNSRLKNDGTIETLPSLTSYWCDSKLIEIDNTKEYHTNINLNVVIAEYNENEEFIKKGSYANTSFTTNFVPDENTKYIRIQGYIDNNIPSADYLVFCESTIPVSNRVYIPYGDYATASLNQEGREKIEINHTNNINDFYNSMLEAFQKGNCDVYIHEGTYIYTNALIENIRSRASLNRGIPIGNGCRYFFDTNTYLVCEYSGNNMNDVINMFSPLDSVNYAHSWELHNLNLTAKNVLYAIHDEASGDTAHYKRLYENCYVSLDNSSGLGTDISKCIGGGAGANGEIIIENCYFSTINPQSTRCPDVSYHGSSANANQNMKIVVNACYFENGFERHTASGTGIMKLLFSNNSVKNNNGRPTSSNENNWFIRSWNNEVRNS